MLGLWVPVDGAELCLWAATSFLVTPLSPVAYYRGKRVACSNFPFLKGTGRTATWIYLVVEGYTEADDHNEMIRSGVFYPVEPLILDTIVCSLYADGTCKLGRRRTRVC
ncbi:hypothetical protein EVAR_20274_1 [Eumeta japonica]|uniref:Uncharacterized protein n=1 Tax=Eumeta variegata TaxID=151549 RepID=A0A4C1VN53_EUMVA|nr:hypothetical protein EVAR_20274_1 [Eumeta japonica]